MQITDSDFTRPKDKYSSYFGRPYDVLVVSDDQTTANMDPCVRVNVSFPINRLLDPELSALTQHVNKGWNGVLFFQATCFSFSLYTQY